MNAWQVKLGAVARTVMAIIMVQTLYFKFTAHPDSVYIFSTIGMEPWGRIAVGVTEAIAAICLFIPRLRFHGTWLTLGLMAGALSFHLFTPLGIEVQHDGGMLFTLAVIVFFSGVVQLWVIAPHPKDWWKLAMFQKSLA